MELEGARPPGTRRDCARLRVRASRGRAGPRVADRGAGACAPSSRTCARACRPAVIAARFHGAVAGLVVRRCAAACRRATGIGDRGPDRRRVRQRPAAADAATPAAGTDGFTVLRHRRAAERRRPGPRPGARRAPRRYGTEEEKPMCLAVPGRVLESSRNVTARGWPRSTSAAWSRRCAWSTCPTCRSASTHRPRRLRAAAARRGVRDRRRWTASSGLGVLEEEFGDPGVRRWSGRAGPRRRDERRRGHEVPRRVQQPRPGQAAARRHPRRRPPGRGRSWRSAAARRTPSSGTASTSCCRDEIELIHGPGCPVCVTPLEIIDKALEIASRPDVIFCSFGDMLRVPGSETRPVPRQERGRRRARRLLAARRAASSPGRTPTGRSCSSASASRPPRRPTR